MSKVRVLIAEDQKIVSEGLRAMLASSDDIEIVDVAEDGLEAVRLALKLTPDVVLMDLSMPRMSGTDATREIKRRVSNCRVLVLTAVESGKALGEARRNGADGCLLKNASRKDLIAALMAVMAGQTAFRVSQASGMETETEAGESAVDSLTRRERQILKMIAEGSKNREIGADLCISVKTVENHRANLMRKLNLHSTAEVTAFAFREGLIGAPGLAIDTEGG